MIQLCEFKVVFVFQPVINYINIHHFKVREAVIFCWYAVAAAENEIYDSSMFVLQNIFSFVKLKRVATVC